MKRVAEMKRIAVVMPIAVLDVGTVFTLQSFAPDEVNGVPYWLRRVNGKTQTLTFYGSD